MCLNITNDKFDILGNSFFESSFAKSCKFIWDFHSKIESKEEWENLSNLYDKFLVTKDFERRKSYPQLIPKKIHQIWVGKKKLPKKVIPAYDGLSINF